jgi:hypothetical protein
VYSLKVSFKEQVKWMLDFSSFYRLAGFLVRSLLLSPFSIVLSHLPAHNMSVE